MKGDSPKPSSFWVCQDREGYALAAGLALGLITLGRGHDAAGLADLHIVDRLRCGPAAPARRSAMQGVGLANLPRARLLRPPL